MKNQSRNLDLSNNSILREYLKLIKANAPHIIIINVFVLIVSIGYVIFSQDIYEAQTDIRISNPQGSILTSDVIPEIGGMGTDLLIANEIQTVTYNYVIREKVARTIIDSAKAGSKSSFPQMVNYDETGFANGKIKDFNEIMEILENNVSVTQIGNLDFISILVESPSPSEAAFIANAYAQAYKEFNLSVNRSQLTTIREILEEQRQEKLGELIQAENNIKTYQLKGGVIQLDVQASSLINRIAEFESKQKTLEVDLAVSKETLEKYRGELSKRDPSLSVFLQSKATEPYLTQLQDQIAKLEYQRDYAVLNNPAATNSETVRDYDAKLAELRNKLKESINRYQSMILSSSPDEIKQLTQKVFEEEVRYKQLNASVSQLGQVLGTYEQKFSNLPGRTLDLARLEREKAVYERLYLALEEKYQEALVNEQSIPGNVFIMNYAYPPLTPTKPNRPLIIFFGAVLGFCFGFGFVYLKDYLNKTVKTPEDVDKLGIPFLTWIPRMRKGKKNDSELVILNDPDSMSSESFRALRTRIQFSKTGFNAKTILITSCAPGEGKTIISSNLASSFAKDNKKTILIDCDLRKPRVHAIFKQDIAPGLTDYLFGKVPFEKIIRITETKNLDFVPAGTIQINPSEILNSHKMVSALQKIRDSYEMVLIDSAPVMAVSDTEVLSNFVNASILVVSANSTEISWIQDSIKLLKNEQNTFLGVVLNNYEYKFGYPSAYKYVGYYSSSKDNKKLQKLKKKIESS